MLGFIFDVLRNMMPEQRTTIFPGVKLPGTFDHQFLYLTTIGRKTGLARQIEIWFVEFEGRVYILAEHGYKALWVKNVIDNPQVAVRIGEHNWTATARVLDAEKNADMYLKARELAREKYGWGDGLPVEVRLVE
jgi:deazaflavin-dependent oxidoreductase (nitroreductase family)